jgi:hypothetical protein
MNLFVPTFGRTQSSVTSKVPRILNSFNILEVLFLLYIPDIVEKTIPSIMLLLTSSNSMYTNITEKSGDERKTMYPSIKSQIVSVFKISLQAA